MAHGVDPWRLVTLEDTVDQSGRNTKVSFNYHSLDNIGLVVEYSPATGETRVRFPDVVLFFPLCHFVCAFILAFGWCFHDMLIA